MLNKSVNKIALFTQTHITQNIQSWAGKLNESPNIHKNATIQITESRVEVKTIKLIQIELNCQTKIKNISKTHTQRAAHKSQVDFFWSEIFELYLKLRFSGRGFSFIILSIFVVIAQSAISELLSASREICNFVSRC